MPVAVKICGINSEEAMAAAVEGGAAYVGLVFFPPSPRAVSAARGAELTQFLPEEVRRVGLFVDPDDDTIARVLDHCRLDIIQLHGRESPERVEQVRFEFGHPVMKAIGVAGLEDLDEARRYAEVADRLLFDARPPRGATRPGGNASSFEWSLLKGRRWPVPWLLAGGLSAENLAEAVAASGATEVDVSSGVEDAPGHKSVERIHTFLELAGRL